MVKTVKRKQIERLEEAMRQYETRGKADQYLIRDIQVIYMAYKIEMDEFTGAIAALENLPESLQERVYQGRYFKRNTKDTEYIAQKKVEINRLIATIGKK